MKYTDAMFKQAIELITKSELPYSVIAMRVGFLNAREMSAVLKRKTGRTSVGYRTGFPREGGFQYNSPQSLEKDFSFDTLEPKTILNVFKDLELFSWSDTLCSIALKNLTLTLGGRTIPIKKVTGKDNGVYGRSDVEVEFATYDLSIQVNVTLFRHSGDIEITYWRGYHRDLLRFAGTFIFVHQTQTTGVQPCTKVSK